jgi:hypothetical protein
MHRHIFPSGLAGHFSQNTKNRENTVFSAFQGAAEGFETPLKTLKKAPHSEKSQQKMQQRQSITVQHGLRFA